MVWSLRGGTFLDVLSLVLAVSSGVGAPAFAVSTVIDRVTSAASSMYDFARLVFDLPLAGAIGYYQDDQGEHHIVVINYNPTKDGGETTHLGQSQSGQPFRGTIMAPVVERYLGAQ